MKNIHFLSEITLQSHLLQSNPHFSGPQKSEKIPEYSLDLGTPPCAKIFHGYVEYFCYRKSFLFWPENVLYKGSALFLDPMKLKLLGLHYPPKKPLTTKKELLTPSRFFSINLQSFCPETCQESTVTPSRPVLNSVVWIDLALHEQHLRHEFNALRHVVPEFTQ